MQIVLFTAFFLLVNGEIYSSRFDVDKLLKFDKHLVVHLQNYLRTAEENLKQLHKLINTFKEDHKAIKNIKGYLDNPINTFFFIRRLTKEFFEIQSLLNNAYEDFDSSIKKESETITLPDESDFPGLIDGLIRLKHLYNLNVSSFVMGSFLKDNSTVKKLTAKNCFEIGTRASNEGLPKEAYEWLEEAHKLCQKGKCKNDLKAEILENMAFQIYMLRDAKRAYKLSKKALLINPNNTRIQGNSKIYLYEANRTPQDERVLEFPLKRPSGNFTPQELVLMTTRQIIWPDEVQSKLFCSYSHNNNPYLRIGPLKEEVLYINPRIVSVKNVINKKEVKVLKKLASPKLNFTLIPSLSTDSFGTDGTVSSSGWLKDSDHQVVSALTKRVESITGLSAVNSEPLEVINYDIGGFTRPHVDVNISQFYGRMDENFPVPRDRGATVLFQLDNSDVGGNLFFPFIKLTVESEEGSAIVWYNIDEGASRHPDFYVTHGVTVILKGQKWVAKKYLTEYEQIFRKPCPIDFKPKKLLDESYFMEIV